jgi:hypothetical protein
MMLRRLQILRTKASKEIWVLNLIRGIVCLSLRSPHSTRRWLGSRQFPISGDAGKSTRAPCCAIGAGTSARSHSVRHG